MAIIPVFVNGVFETKVHAEARQAFNNRSALVRFIPSSGTYYVFSPASASLGHHTSQMNPPVRSKYASTR